MQIAPLPDCEATRLNSLYEYQILDTDPEAAFDDLTTLAATLCNTPIALISLLDEQRQWFKSKVGVDATETPRDIAFCSHAILHPEILIVPDTLADERFSSNPLVVDEPYIRSYAGAPLISSDGHILGTLCVIDFIARELTLKQIESLQALSRQVVAQMDLRCKLLQEKSITQVVQESEAALCESESRFRTMANSAPVLIWVDNLDRKSTFFNQTWLQFTGRTLDQEVGEGWKQNLHPDDQKRWTDTYNAAFDDRVSYTTEYRLRQADGIYHWLLEMGVPRFLPDGTFMGFTGSCVDITDRKSAEQDSQLLQTVTHAIVTSTDFHSALAVALQKVCEATQWEFGEAWIPSLDKSVMECSSAWYGKSDRLGAFRQQSETFTFLPGIGIPGRVWVSRQTEWHQDVSIEAETVYHRVQLALEAGFNATLGIPILANDEVITVLVFYMFEARLEDQRLIDLIAASTELGLFIQRKQAEEEVRKSLAREQDLNRFKSNFIANLSHELRTPLTSVLGLSALLLQQHFGSINEKQEQYLSLIHESGTHLLNLINDLLDMAKIEAGKHELNISLVDVAELCQSAIELMGVRATSKQQKLSLILPVAAESIAVDYQRILQILLNYLANAVKFTPNGGAITLSSRLASGLDVEKDTLPVEDREGTVPQLSQEACFLVLSVGDTGVGIPLEKQHILFQRFQQISAASDAASDYQYNGAGLGLALSKQLAEVHGGRVSFTSTLGEGSTFSLWLPLGSVT